MSAIDNTISLWVLSIKRTQEYYELMIENKDDHQKSVDDLAKKYMDSKKNIQRLILTGIWSLMLTYNQTERPDIEKIFIERMDLRDQKTEQISKTYLHNRDRYSEIEQKFFDQRFKELGISLDEINPKDKAETDIKMETVSSLHLSAMLGFYESQKELNNLRINESKAKPAESIKEKYFQIFNTLAGVLIGGLVAWFLRTDPKDLTQGLTQLQIEKSQLEYLYTQELYKANKVSIFQDKYFELRDSLRKSKR